MGEFKRGEQTSWDLDEEIRTWKRKEAVLTGGGDGKESKEDEELTPILGSLKHAELGDSSKQVGPEAGCGEVRGDMGEQGPAEPIVSHEDITMHYLPFFLYICNDCASLKALFLY